jgi:cyanate permease
LSVGLFAPIAPQLRQAASLTEAVSRQTDVFQLKSLIRSIFAGLALLIGWIAFGYPQKESLKKT